MIRIRKNYLLTIAILIFAISAACLLICACGHNDEPNGEEKEVSSISLDTTNATLAFDVGDGFSCDGVLVNVLYADNSVIPMFAIDCTVSSPDMSQKGVKSVSVSYKEKSAEYQITVRELLSISVDAGAVTDFAPFDEFDYSGITVYAHYSDGVADSVVPENKFTVSSPDMTTCGQKTVTVSYKEKTAAYIINVKNVPVIINAELTDKNNVAGLIISGTVNGYSQSQFGLDLQKLGTDERVKVSSEVTFGEDGAFEIYCNLSLLELNYGSDYMIHVLLDGAQYDVADVQTPAEGTVKFDDIIYKISSEQWFNNNPSYFVVLRCGNEKDLEEKTVTINSAAIVQENDKIFYVVGGSYTGAYSQNDFVLDVEDTINWSGKTQLKTTATLENGNFTVRAEITSLGACRYITHLIVNGNSMDIKDLSVTEKQFDTDIKRFEFSSQDIFNNGQHFYATLTVTHIVEPKYTITGATLEERDGKVYFVLSGDCNATTQEFLNGFSIYFDFESNPYAMTGGWTGDWVRYCNGNLKLVLDGENRFKTYVDVTDLKPYTYTAHCGAADKNFEFEGANVSLTVNGKNYALSFGESGFFGATGLTITSAEHTK